MDEDLTPRLALPLLYAGQAQKEITHNEALIALDSLVQLVVQAVTPTPPDAPEPGACWIVGESATGEWSAHDGMVAAWTEGGWRFHALAAWSIADQLVFRRQAGGWSSGEVEASRIYIGGDPVVGPRQGAIDDPAGGSVVDVEARAVISQLLAAMRLHGLIAAG